MNDLIARLTASAGLDEATARSAVGLILNFLAREGPADAVAKLMDAMPGAQEAMAAGPQPSGTGIMGLGADLMGAGLSMGQIQTVGRELFAYGRANAGEDAMGEIVGSVPGLSQFV